LKIKNNHSAQKIFQNPVANLKARKIQGNLDSKKYVKGNRYFLIRIFCKKNYLEDKITITKKFPFGAFGGIFQNLIFFFLFLTLKKIFFRKKNR
jgi:hypothetical protein